MPNPLLRKRIRSLYLVKVNSLSNPITPPEAAWIDQTALLQQIQEQLEQSGAALRSEGFRATAISLTGALLDEIVSIVRKEKIDLIVLGTHGKKGLERLILGSDAEAVLRNVSCPVLTVGPGVSAVRDKVWPPKNIICATTLDPDSAWIAAYAYSLAQQLCAEFTLTHVEQMGGHHQDSDWRRFEDAFRQHLPADIKPSPFRWTSLLSDVSPGAELVDFAKKQDADLIVMGARIASALTTHLRVGIAPRVFADAPCPVMTLHQP